MQNCDPDLVNVVDRAIRMDREERYASYDEITADLCAVLQRLVNTHAANDTVKARRSQLREE
jgi:hypothetical protein